ncbi:hypothetical protein AQUCO_05100013v1 [Aquilegia coerulea]|uniref:Uncharacterized protein n=1 Tax=Aquilegia coerulea TaxID=218851 RepID=A0A2G5CIV2_AQUCA|nr:hypothetical protein AQUCO_05100013v1 [Aquilegia coerulea]
MFKLEKCGLYNLNFWFNFTFLCFSFFGFSENEFQYKDFISKDNGIGCYRKIFRFYGFYFGKFSRKRKTII